MPILEKLWSYWHCCQFRARTSKHETGTGGSGILRTSWKLPLAMSVTPSPLPWHSMPGMIVPCYDTRALFWIDHPSYLSIHPFPFISHQTNVFSLPMWWSLLYLSIVFGSIQFAVQLIVCYFYWGEFDVDVTIWPLTPKWQNRVALSQLRHNRS